METCTEEFGIHNDDDGTFPAQKLVAAEWIEIGLAFPLATSVEEGS
ncbi:MAG: hypothetical protein GY696_33905 [Gammaproteobacteria bacterium]|nr:hypothetical protein [Gammaproteobacteria bacterium]